MTRSIRDPVTFTAASRLRPYLAPRKKAPKGPAAVVTVKNLHESGAGSLRAAVQYANAHPNTTIDFAFHLHGAIKLTSGELIFSENTTIEGPGAAKLAVSGTNHSRVFVIGIGKTVKISGLTITEGLANSKASGVICFGGGILNQGVLILKQAVVSHNQAIGVAGNTFPLCGCTLTGAGGGGGVANLGTLIVSNTKFVDNEAKGAAKSADPGKSNTYPGVAIGGGLANVGMATAIVTHCRFTGNLARGGDGCVSPTGFAGDSAGGAIASFGFSDATSAKPNIATLTISGSHFSKNQAIGGNGNQSYLLPGHSFGGAVASHRFSGSAEMIVSGCTFDHNQAIGGKHNVVITVGGKVDLRAIPNMAAAGGLFACGKAMISDSMFDHNEAIGGDGVNNSSGIPVTKNGGAAYGGGFSVAFPKTDVTISACVIKHNLAVGGHAGVGGSGGIARGGGVGITATGPIVTIVDSMIELNHAQGGNGSTSGSPSNGGNGEGGGVYTILGSTTTLTDGSITHNRATGGRGEPGGNDGNGIGGGLYYLGATTFDTKTITGNHASTSNNNIYP